MHRALAAALVLLATSCAGPTGSARTACGADWLDAPAVIAQAVGLSEQPVAIECIEAIEDRRVRVGFFLPAGPDCDVLQRVGLVESADAISITMIVAVGDDAAAGACLDERQRVVSEIDLAAPVGDRVLLDGSS